MRKIFVLASLAACGSNDTRPIDAARPIDTARPIDALPDTPPDALFDAPAPPANAHRFVIDHEHQPTTNNEARMYGLDLNNDGTVDNQFGMVLATFSGMGLASQPGLDHAIDTGAIEILADIEATDLTTAQATVTLFDGADAMPAPCHGTGDTTCRHHLAGTATFDVATTSAHDTPLAGAIAAGILDAGPGTLHLRTMLLGAPVDLKLIGARVRLNHPSDAGIMAGIVAGALTQAEIDASLIPALDTAMTAQVALDCNALTTPPACGCANGSPGSEFISLFDANHDCAVSSDELEANSLIMSLLAPDVTIDAMPALSFGVGISAVHAAFTP